MYKSSNQLIFNDLSPSMRHNTKSVITFLRSKNHSDLYPEIKNASIVIPGKIKPLKKYPNAALYNLYFSFYKRILGNPLGSLIHSKIMLLPHQVQTSIKVINSMIPRYLIADEVGLGKTIETGLILKEMKLKYYYNKILIIVPAPLVYQWQKELEYKFNESFTIIDRKSILKNPDIIQKENMMITSIDFSKNEPYKELFARERYDLIIFDEAHRLRKDEKFTTQAWNFANDLSHNTTSLLLLSATPFRGKIDEIYYLISLINPDILPPLSSIKKEYETNPDFSLSEMIQPVVIRRRKKDIGGFTKRFVKTVKISLKAEERKFYDETTSYVQSEYDLAKMKGNHFKSFIMIIFQKLLDSSSSALLKALEKRKKKLENSYFYIASTMKENSKNEINDWNHFPEDYDLDEAMEYLENNVEIDIKDIVYELETVNRLLTIGRKIDTDTKIEMLKKSIKEFQKAGHEKFIIFTQFRKTQDYIYNHLKELYPAGVFHGGMDAKEKECIIEKFYENLTILILTDAGAEGRNLQIASVLINYDLPWSPVKMEQRIGRIHRFGQKRDVYILNYASKNTIAEKVIDILQYKIKLFENAFGSSDVLLGALDEDRDYYKNLWDFLQNKKTETEIKNETLNHLKSAKESVQLLDNLLSVSTIDYNLKAYEKALNMRSHQYQYEKDLKKLTLLYFSNHFLPYKKYPNDIYEFELSEQKNKIQSDNHHNPNSFIQNFCKGSFHLKTIEKNDSLAYFSMGHPLIEYVQKKMDDIVKSKTIFYFLHPSIQGIKIDIEVNIQLDRKYRFLYSGFANKENDYKIEYPESHIFQIEKIKNIPFFYTEQNKKIRQVIQSFLFYIQDEIKQEINNIKKRIQSSMEFYLRAMETSHSEQKKELEEKIEVQKSKLLWYGEKNMISAIKRNINKKDESYLHYQKKINKIKSYLNEKISIHISHIGIYEKDNKVSLR